MTASIGRFILLAYAISWLIWLPLVSKGLGWADLPAPQYLHLIGGIGPMAAALAVTAWIGGRAALEDLLRRSWRWRVDARLHAIAWLSPVLLYAIGAVTVRVVWGVWPNFGRFGRTDEFPNLPLLVYWLLVIVFYGWGEEVGWRGFLLPKLQRRWSALTSSALLTPIWTAWHLPLFFFIDGYRAMAAWAIVGWLASVFVGAILMTWLYNSSRGSLPVVAIFHGTLDIVFNSPSAGDLALVLGVVVTLWGLGILALRGPRNLATIPRQIEQAWPSEQRRGAG